MSVVQQKTAKEAAQILKRPLYGDIGTVNIPGAVTFESVCARGQGLGSGGALGKIKGQTQAASKVMCAWTWWQV
jgi:hypothetical protein